MCEPFVRSRGTDVGRDASLPISESFVWITTERSVTFCRGPNRVRGLRTPRSSWQPAPERSGLRKPFIGGMRAW